MQQTAQLNTRINQDLKQRGDAAFAEAGLTSSEAIRLLYTFAAEHRHEPELIVQRLSNESDEERAKRERGLSAIRRGRHLFDEALAQLGIDNPDPEILTMPYDQLKELAFAEKYGMEFQA